MRKVRNEYLVVSNRLELPRNTWITTFRRFQYKFNSLIMFRIANRISIGRWHPNVDGCNWIVMPGVRLCLLGCRAVIIGEVRTIRSAKLCRN